MISFSLSVESGKFSQISGTGVSGSFVDFTSIGELVFEAISNTSHLRS
jgi:hypothetical protein